MSPQAKMGTRNSAGISELLFGSLATEATRRYKINRTDGTDFSTAYRHRLRVVIELIELMFFTFLPAPVKGCARNDGTDF